MKCLIKSLIKVLWGLERNKREKEERIRDGEEGVKL
jgi:hypothetical protein